MKIKDIIKVLQRFDPETEPNFCFGFDRTYRKCCAELALKNYDGECTLSEMTISSIKSAHFEDGHESVRFILKQNFYKDDVFTSYQKEYIKKNGVEL